MSQISSATVLALAVSPWAAVNPPTSAGTAPGANDTLASDAALFSLGASALDLWTMNAAVDNATFQANALSTANDAIGVIGGLLQNVQAVLTAADPASGQPFNPSTDQPAIDGAVSTIDAIASSAQFGGQPLLNGTFNLSTDGATLSLPSFLSPTLGGTPSDPNGAPSAALASLVGGGANDLSSGNLAAAGQIVATAMTQVGSAQALIASFQPAAISAESAGLPDPVSTVAQPAPRSPADDIYLAAAQMLGDPFLTSLAIANASAQNTLALLQF